VVSYNKDALFIADRPERPIFVFPRLSGFQNNLYISCGGVGLNLARKGWARVAFDIEMLLNFQPAKHWCQKCFTLFREPYTEMHEAENYEFLQCNVCKVKYIATDEFSVHSIGPFLRLSPQPLRDVKDLIAHGTSFARVAYNFKQKSYPPVRSLLRAILNARSFIHFVSYGISPTMIGILKLAAQYVPIRGVVAGTISENVISEVDEFKDEAPGLSLHFWKHSNFRGMDEPHHKIVVIDGLIAFKGSANLTHTAWRSVSNGMDILEVVTDTDEVIKLHNCFFSPLWAKQSNVKDEILMDDDVVPF
jgi:Zn finger protein HypA/HybF involved in hydrogenase expression